MSAAENLDVQTQIKNMLVNHPDSADAVMAQLKDQHFEEIIPDEQFRELIQEVNNRMKGCSKDHLEQHWMSRLLDEFIEFVQDRNLDKQFLELIKKDDYMMDRLREDADFKEQIIGELPCVADLDSDELIGEVMKRFYAHDMDIRYFINDVQLNNPLVMRRRE